MGMHHIRVLSQMERVKLVGVVDIDGSVEAKVSDYAVDFFLERERLLEAKPQLVVVAVPTTQHVEVATDVLRNRSHVLVEKPIADKLEDANKLVRLAEELGLKLFVGHIERFNPVVRTLKDLVASGRFGKVQSIANLRVGRYKAVNRDTGIILDLGTHDIDIISFLFGKKVKSVFATADLSGDAGEDQASIALRFSDNEAGYIELSWLTPYKVRKMFITGSLHFGLVDLVERTIIIYDGNSWAKMEKAEAREPLRIELESVLNSIEQDLPPEVGGQDSTYTLSVALSAIKSAKEGKAVEFSEHFEGDIFPT